MHGAECFDNSFFNVSAAEASVMDPQQRLLLELGYTALHGAGLTRARLVSSDTGVYLGIQAIDWTVGSATLLPPSRRGSSYAVTGGTLSVAAGRLSFVLGLHGPCMSIDTACSAFHVAVHTGAQALRAQECNRAVALGINLTLLPAPTLACAAAGMLSARGRCQTFDAAADGYVRSEGGGALALGAQPGSGAWPLVAGSAVRQDGRSASLTAPNGAAQKVLLGTALYVAGVGIEQLRYVETHGTGTALGDPTEMRAIAEELILPASAHSGARITFGGVKANLGHLEPAAGVAGIARCCAQMRIASPSPSPSQPWP